MRRAACRSLRTAQELCLARLLTSSDYSCLQTRGIRLFDIFDKSKVKERRQKLKEEASRGYWDDFKELKDTKGKLFTASKSLLPASRAARVPQIQVLDSEGLPLDLQSAVSESGATLVCLAFRSGAEARHSGSFREGKDLAPPLLVAQPGKATPVLAQPTDSPSQALQEMLASWSRPFGEQFAESGSQHIELSLVESEVMTWWPFRNMILKGRSSAAESAQLKPLYLFHFGDATPLIQALQLSNRLTGYVFLLDRKGRVRWRGSGMAVPEEVSSLLQAAQVIDDHDKAT